MKKIPGVVLLLVVLLACYGAAMAAGGSAEDPLISKNYLEGDYAAGLLAEAETKRQESGRAVYQEALSALEKEEVLASERLRLFAEGYRYQPVFADFRAKRADVITGITGTGFLLLAGEAKLSYASGAVVDVTAGKVFPSGTAMTPGHRYLTAEKTVALVTVSSPTAVLSTEGYFFHAASGETDYNALAGALRALGLFRGSGTPYGSGYALEDTPTRIQGLVMFLRLIGEEEAALACKDKNPFKDADPWCDRYLAYAFARGYTNGTNLAAGQFSPQEPVSATQYMTFLLRAMGYSDTGEGADFAWDKALAAGGTLGVLTGGEQNLLETEPFSRAQMVYVSYYSLGSNLKNSGQTMLSRLISTGALSQGTVDTVVRDLKVQRLP